MATAALALLLPAAASSADGGENTIYSLAGGCYAMRTLAADRFIEKSEDGQFMASEGGARAAERFRMQATDLGSYLLYDTAGDFLAIAAGGVGSPERIAAVDQPSPAADWSAHRAGGGFILRAQRAGEALTVSGEGTLRPTTGEAGAAARFSFERAKGCARYPEVEVNASGKPLAGLSADGEVRGFLEAHMHHMAYEFLGGRAHCGRPWHRYGAPYALQDCPDHYPNGAGAILENTVSHGNPVGMHDPVGWPTFNDWPSHDSLTHEQSYYKWLERAWRGGLRVFVDLLVENRALCEAYPYTQNDCDEMASVRLQARRARELERYIDAQSGGPGKGWYRIVTTPSEARRVIADGKLAVVLGMEVSEPFGCILRYGKSQCNRAEIASGLEEIHRLGIRQVELVNKFDNGLTGVAGDHGATGVITNFGNFSTTGRFWDLDTCDDPENTDRSPTAIQHNDDEVVGNGIRALLPGGTAPVYPSGPHCNNRGLSSLGAFAVRGLMRRGMIFDPDHMSVLGRDQALALVESRDYPGVLSSHSWSTASTYPRVYELGGVVAPYAGSAESFVEKWKLLRKAWPERRGAFALGYGADMNGFGAQGGPRQSAESDPVRYPFTSFDGSVTLGRQRSGERIFDINRDGVAHYGLYPDWIEDLRVLAGDRIVSDLSRGAEAYLQMWERACDATLRSGPRRGASRAGNAC